MPLVAITMFGVTTPCVLRVQAGLERARLRDGRLPRHRSRRPLDGGADRRRSHRCRRRPDDERADRRACWAATCQQGRTASKRPGGSAFPQVVVPGALELVNWGPVETIPERFRTERKIHVHNATVSNTRTTVEESRQLGEILAAKVNRTIGPAIVLLPLRGLSAIDAPGGPYEDEEADSALFDAIRVNLRSDIPLREIDANINDPPFADAVLAAFDEVWGGKR